MKTYKINYYFNTLHLNKPFRTDRFMLIQAINIRSALNKILKNRFIVLKDLIGIQEVLK